jgi:hypothetical protein
MLSILNSLVEYFHMANEALPIYDDGQDLVEQKPIYIIFAGSKTWVYISYEEVIEQKIGVNIQEAYLILEEIPKYR